MKNKFYLSTKKTIVFLFFLSTTALFSQKAQIFYDKDYKGKKADLQERGYNRWDLYDLGIGDNEISSIKVLPGYEVVIYDLDEFNANGAAKLYTANQADLTTMSNKMSSVIVRKIRPKVATFYYDNNYKGKSVALPEGEFPLNELKLYGIDDNQISSVKVNSGYQVTIFNYDNYDVNAHAQSFNGLNIPEFDSHMLNNLMTSVIIRKIPTKKAIFYLDFNYKGKTILLPEGIYGRSNLGLLGLDQNKRILSVKTAGMKVTLYEGHHYSGSSKSFNSDKMNLNQIGWNIITKSIKVFDTRFNSLAGGGLGSGNDEGDDEDEIENRTSANGTLQFEVYPNPASNFVDVSHSSEIEKIELLNFSGERVEVKVTESPSTSGSRIDLSNFRNGIYVLVGTTKDGKSVTKKIAIQK